MSQTQVTSDSILGDMEAVMKRTLMTVGVLALMTAASFAGTVQGKVSGVWGKSIVYVEGAPAKPAPAGQKYVIDQQGMQFTPHVLVVPVGGTVTFTNHDNVAHNVFWPSIGGDKHAAGNLGTFPGGQQRTFTFNKVGVAPLLCNVHPEMSAYIVVVPAGYYAETDASGNYKIDDVPNGSYKVTAWHEQAKPATKPVTVGASPATVDFSF